MDTPSMMNAGLFPSLPPIVPGSTLDRRRNWYVIRALNVYRLTLCMLLIGVFVIDHQSRFFGTAKPVLFMWTSLAYLVAILLFVATSLWRKPSWSLQIHVQGLTDLLAVTILVYASGGISSNLSILLAMAIAANGILLPLYSTLSLAALAFFMLVVQWLLDTWQRRYPNGNILDLEQLQHFFVTLQFPGDDMGRIGVLGATFFAAALTTYTLADRARRSEELARQRSRELLEMAEMNQAIVQHLQSGIVVVDGLAQIRLMNDTACELLDFHRPTQGLPLSEISPSLSQRLATWLATGMHQSKPFRQAEHLPDLTPNFSHLGGSRGADTLIFLEDSTQVSTRLQQIKLAALGRLTAGIAHEIRNPLASISHAAQLLNESPTASVGDRRLGQIIHDNAKRANAIIANVLDLSRRDKTRPEDIGLKNWLENFRQEFLRARGEPQPQMEVEVRENVQVQFDPGQLHQILWNLCNNACLHGTLPNQLPRIRLRVDLESGRQRPYLDVVDSGPGLSSAEGRKIFEPFFTTKTQGTGLGLYISREMCEANRAQLQYLPPPEGGCCFRITFPNLIKQIA